MVARRLGDGHEPQRRDAEVVGRGRVAIVERVEALGEAAQVTDAVAVGVGETAHEDLVEDGVVPPRGRVGRRWARGDGTRWSGCGRGVRTTRSVRVLGVGTDVDRATARRQRQHQGGRDRSHAGGHRAEYRIRSRERDRARRARRHILPSRGRPSARPGRRARGASRTMPSMSRARSRVRSKRSARSRDRDVVLVDGAGGLRARQLTDLGARVVTVDARVADAFEARTASADVVVACGPPSAAHRPTRSPRPSDCSGRAGACSSSMTTGATTSPGCTAIRPEYGPWSRRDGPFLSNGFKDPGRPLLLDVRRPSRRRATFLDEAFGDVGRRRSARTLQRPRLSYNVAVYHRTFGELGRMTGRRPTPGAPRGSRPASSSSASPSSRRSPTRCTRSPSARRRRSRCSPPGRSSSALTFGALAALLPAGDPARRSGRARWPGDRCWRSSAAARRSPRPAAWPAALILFQLAASGG